MSQGLQVWDASGILKLDVTNRLGVLLGAVDTNGANGSLPVPWPSKGSPFFFANLLESGNIASVAPHVYVSNNIIYWDYSGPGAAKKLNARIFYGVY